MVILVKSRSMRSGEGHYKASKVSEYSIETKGEIVLDYRTGRRGYSGKTVGRFSLLDHVEELNFRNHILRISNTSNFIILCGFCKRFKVRPLKRFKNK